MKFFFYTALNDISSASNCRDISKQRERAFSAPSPVVQNFQKAESE